MKSVVLFLIALFVALTMIIWAVNSENLSSSVVIVVFAALVLLLFGVFAFRRYKDASLGLPFEDERSRRVMEKAAAKTFFVALYLLLFIGMLSDDLINFRDVSQATSITVGLMALIWFGFWIYYSKKEI